jgi:N utilization substance protein B
MVNRRFVREKVVQTCYAYHMVDTLSIKLANKSIAVGFQEIRRLYVYNLSFIVALSDYFNERFQIGSKKFIPTEKELNPNTRFIRNRVIEYIRNSPTFREVDERYKFNARENNVLLKNLYEQIVKSEPYQIYLESEDNLAEDVDYLRRLYKNRIVTNETFRDICEGKSLYWASDYHSVAYWVYEQIKKFGTEKNDLFMKDHSSDLEFGTKLFNETILHREEYKEMIYVRLENWEPERVALLDRIIIITAIAEFIHFPQIPIKVTLNEFIEISKVFCSERSRIFINGLLHKISVDLIEQGIIKKSGRGLI